MVNDFEFIQPFRGNRVPIDEGRKIRRKSQKELSDLNMVTTRRCSDHDNKCTRHSALAQMTDEVSIKDNSRYID
jgi:hypothetical protein